MSLPLTLNCPLRNSSLYSGSNFGIDHGRVSTMFTEKTYQTPSSKRTRCASVSQQKLNHKPCEFKRDEVELEEKVRSISQRMRKLKKGSMEELVMIDTIQRLGMDHLFQQEIEEVLHKHYMECFSESKSVDGFGIGLHEVSLRFRLLRQEGYNVSSHTLDGFLGQDRKFKEELGNDTQGMVSLFEASHMSTHGEWILDEANVFSKRILNTSLEKLDEYHTMLVQNSLKHPLQKTVARFTAHDYFGMHSGANDWRSDLQEVARMDFNAARVIYQNEILHISKWWKALGLAEELKFARDQPLKWHMWSLAMLPDPSMSKQRIEITKTVSFIYIIDDIFDLYGTPEDLLLFAEAVNRWEFDTLGKLPEYMKLCLKAFFDVTDEISHQIRLKSGCDPKVSLRKAWIDLLNAFLIESKWFAEGSLPTSTEYLKVATITSGIHVVATHLHFLLGGESNTCECSTRISTSTAKILRLWDDFGSSEDEEQDGNDGSYIKCYMNEQEGVSIEVAREHVADLISDAWKSLNQESTQSPPYPSSSVKAFTKGCLNLARMVPLMYSYDEIHSLPDLEKFVESLLYKEY